ncbi:hypothetical protein [Kosakonia cowanii]|uniref:hypothetical protein n=1 Tax=Kosakonia cowanii TaxID=208223 RepID=UPI004064164D
MIEFKLSDWVSSLATFGTFVVAVMAYRSAPNWFQQKKVEIGVEHVHSLLKDYDQLRNITSELYYDIISSDLSGREDLLVRTHFIASKGVELRYNLQACGRWGITFLPETYRCFSQYVKFCETIYKIKAYENNSVVTQKLKEDLGKVMKTIDTNSDDLNKNLSDYFTFPQ